MPGDDAVAVPRRVPLRPRPFAGEPARELRTWQVFGVCRHNAHDLLVTRHGPKRQRLLVLLRPATIQNVEFRTRLAGSDTMSGRPQIDLFDMECGSILFGFVGQALDEFGRRGFVSHGCLLLPVGRSLAAAILCC